MKTFGSRLRYERERRQIDLRSIAESTKIAVPLLQGLERDDVSRWPSGIFRKSFIRSYAEAIGMDPEPVVREFADLFPDPLEAELAAIPAAPLARHSQVPPKSTPPTCGRQVPRPLAIKLTITWSGSVHHTIVRLADWKIVRLLLDGEVRRRIQITGNLIVRICSISSNLPIVNRRMLLTHWIRGRRSGSGSACRSTSRVTGAVSPSPKARNFSR